VVDGANPIVGSENRVETVQQVIPRRWTNTRAIENQYFAFHSVLERWALEAG
jgi:hypothetical protein